MKTKGVEGILFQSIIADRAKAPNMKKYMRDWRKRKELREWPIKPGADWRAEFDAWNLTHYKMKYRSIAKFRKDWEKENRDRQELS